MDVCGMGRDELKVVFFIPTSSVISNSGQNACLAPSSARSLLREFMPSRLHFQATNASKTFGGRALPGPAGELKRSPRPPNRSVGINTSSSHSLVPTAWKAEGGMDVRGMDRDE